MTETPKPFNPNEHLTPLPRQQKNKTTGYMETVHDQYLEVKWRIVWFREVFPHGSIKTEELLVDLDREVEVEATRWVPNPKQQGKNMKETYTKKARGYARYRATVTDGLGGEATGTKTETAVDFGDFCEKAETGAIGRALAVLGFGTQFTGDELKEKHRIVDSPLKEDMSDQPSHENTVSNNHSTPKTPTPIDSKKSEPALAKVEAEFNAQDALDKLYERAKELHIIEDLVGWQSLKCDVFGKMMPDESITEKAQCEQLRQEIVRRVKESRTKKEVVA